MKITRRVGGAAAVVFAATIGMAGLSACSGGGSTLSSTSAADPAVAFADSSGGNDSGSASGAAEAGSAARSDQQSAPDAAKEAAGQADSADSADSALPSGSQVVRTAGQTVRVDDVRAAAARARTAALALGGYVASENLYLGDPGDPGDPAEPEPRPIDSNTGATSSLTLRVPEKSTDTALDRLAALGKELNRTSTADDVTAQVADLSSRVATQERSVKRVRELLDRASSIKDIVLLESELSRREGDLEAAQARSRALEDQATLATINLQLVSKNSPLPAGGDDDGFLSGLGRGWDALVSSTVAVLTGVGAVLPFAVLLAVLGVPGYLLWRRLRPGRQRVEAPVDATQTPAPSTASPGSSPAPDQP